MSFSVTLSPLGSGTAVMIQLYTTASAAHQRTKSVSPIVLEAAAAISTADIDVFQPKFMQRGCRGFCSLANHSAHSPTSVPPVLLGGAAVTLNQPSDVVTDTMVGAPGG